MRALAFAAAVGCAIWSIGLSDHPAVVWIGCGGLILTLAAVASARPWIAVLALFALAGGYALALELSDVTVDFGAPFVGVALFLLLEGAETSGNAKRPKQMPEAAALRRGIVAATALGGLALGAIGLVLGAAARGSGAPLFALAAAAAIGILYLLTLLARDRVPGG